MNLTIDIGNSTTKVGLFEGDTLKAYEHIEGHELTSLAGIKGVREASMCIVSSTVNISGKMRQDLSDVTDTTPIYLDHTTPLPIRNLYSTPETLGTDRLAAAIGAQHERPGSNVLVIDMGTAITYDFVNSRGEYLGGNISPGIEMRLKSLNQFTARLPLIKAKGDKPAIGHDTETAIRCGVIDGVKHEIEGFIKAATVKYPDLFVFLTGGDMIDFDDSIKRRTFADNYLVLKGLNRILRTQQIDS